jgi:hypothetical protein
MDRDKPALSSTDDPQTSSATTPRRAWEEPKLTFIAPKLTRHGKLEEVTGQFFGPFSPGRMNGTR